MLLVYLGSSVTGLSCYIFLSALVHTIKSVVIDKKKWGTLKILKPTLSFFFYFRSSSWNSSVVSVAGSCSWGWGFLPFCHQYSCIFTFLFVHKKRTCVHFPSPIPVSQNKLHYKTFVLFTLQKLTFPSLIFFQKCFLGVALYLGHLFFKFYSITVCGPLSAAVVAAAAAGCPSFWLLCCYFIAAAAAVGCQATAPFAAGCSSCSALGDAVFEPGNSATAVWRSINLATHPPNYCTV